MCMIAKAGYVKFLSLPHHGYTLIPFFLVYSSYHDILR